MQSKVDSIMEVVTNTAIGFVLSMITWRFVALAYGIPMPMMENLSITAIFTVVSLLRSYAIRRIFNGRTIWQALKDRFGSYPVAFGHTHPALQARKRVQQLIERP